jgi:hypothetical protein
MVGETSGSDQTQIVEIVTGTETPLQNPLDLEWFPSSPRSPDKLEGELNLSRRGCCRGQQPCVRVECAG